MSGSTVSLGRLATTSRRFAVYLLNAGENRLELLTVEIQEERTRLLHAFLYALGAAAFALLAGIALSTAIVVLLWPYAPVTILFALTALYGGIGALFYWRIAAGWQDHRMLAASLGQLRKDRACLEELLA